MEVTLFLKKLKGLSSGRSINSIRSSAAHPRVAPSPGSRGRTITDFSRSTSARPAFPFRGFRTYFFCVTITGTRPALRVWE
jgi:hypothetical protein